MKKLIILLSLAFYSCGEESSGGDQPAPAPEASEEESEEQTRKSDAPQDGTNNLAVIEAPTSDPGGPVVYDFGLDRGVIKPNESFQISTLIGHPGGIGKVIGGYLADPELSEKGMTGRYGTFTSPAQEGAYQFALNWTQIQHMRGINQKRGGGNRDFRAIFFDETGKRAVQNFKVNLMCESKKHSICDGTCKATLSDKDNCGRCGNSCDGECALGQCVKPATDVTERKTCNDVCKEQGSVCAPGAKIKAYYSKSSGASRTINTMACDKTVPSSHPDGYYYFKYLKCSCVKSAEVPAE